jgi:hypothetical protein
LNQPPTIPEGIDPSLVGRHILIPGHWLAATKAIVLRPTDNWRIQRRRRQVQHQNFLSRRHREPLPKPHPIQPTRHEFVNATSLNPGQNASKINQIMKKNDLIMKK